MVTIIQFFANYFFNEALINTNFVSNIAYTHLYIYQLMPKR